jgi:hypothetical protein
MKNAHPLLEQKELLKEIHFRFDGIEPVIIGRIYKIVEGLKATGEYEWRLNYYNRIESQGTIYIPGRREAGSASAAETMLLQYVKRFEICVDLWKDEFF